jgi:hypothetical protein
LTGVARLLTVAASRAGAFRAGLTWAGRRSASAAAVAARPLFAEAAMNHIDIQSHLRLAAFRRGFEPVVVTYPTPKRPTWLRRWWPALFAGAALTLCLAFWLAVLYGAVELAAVLAGGA